MVRLLNSRLCRSCGLALSETFLFCNPFSLIALWVYFFAVFMYLSERYLEMLQSADVEEPKSSQHKNGKVLQVFFFFVVGTCVSKWPGTCNLKF